MAASSESLFNLVDQLQHLESTVTNLIFEMAFKLSSLTSCNIFVMVENNLGRKYAGKPHLCAEYATTGLKALQNDIKVEFDPESGSIKEFSSHHRVPDVGINDDDDDDDDLEEALFRHDLNVPKMTTTSINGNKKRRHSARDSGISTTGDKRRRHYNRSLNVAVDSAVQHDDDDDDSFARSEDLLRIAKFENEAAHFDRGANDDEVLIEEFTMDDGTAAAAAAAASTLLDHNARNREMIQGRAHHFNSSRELSDNAAAAVSIDVDSYFKNNEKVAALRTLTFEVAGVEVNALAPAFKIMTSVLYDVAKMASATSPTSDKRDPHARAHFDKHFDRIMIEFPQLRMLTDQGVKVKTAGFGSFVRSTMQKTFGKLLDKASQADAKGGAENHALKPVDGHLRSPFSAIGGERLEWNDGALKWNT